MWSLVTAYGMRWKIEELFSSIKRIFGGGVGNVTGGDAPRGRDESGLLQHADDYGGLTGGATGMSGGNRYGSYATQRAMGY